MGLAKGFEKRPLVFGLEITSQGLAKFPDSKYSVEENLESLGKSVEDPAKVPWEVIPKYLFEPSNLAVLQDPVLQLGNVSVRNFAALSTFSNRLLGNKRGLSIPAFDG